MSLEKLLRNIDVISIKGCYDGEITGVTSNHRNVKKGHVWICYEGVYVDGHKFMDLAINKGAKVIIGEKPPPDDLPADLVYVRTENGRIALAHAAANWFWHPADWLKLIGITGTNGKTSTSHFIEAIFRTARIRAAVLGTIGHRFGKKKFSAPTTTPDQMRLHRMFSEIVSQKIEHVIMETSSQGLSQHRLEGLNFHTGVFTNLTQDHLDYHGSIKKYLNAKLKLFQQLDSSEGVAIVNIDDPAAESVIAEVRSEVVTYSLRSTADLTARDLVSDLSGISFTAVTPIGEIQISLKMLGDYNIYNALAAIGVTLRYGLTAEQIQNGLSKTIVPGRFELVDRGQNFAVVVDYAHTPDALENLLNAAQRIRENRLISVFGCGGDRDATKRPIMGKISTELADHTVITSDNPRTEEPDTIVKDIITGVNEGESYEVILDRRQAIAHAIRMAESGDLIVIAGKGHEDYQIIGKEKLHFDDREVAGEILDQINFELLNSPL